MDDATLQDLASRARELRWGVKGSFLDYLSGMPDFTHSLGGGVQALPHEQTFAFPAEGEGLRFAGELRFVAHFGALRVEMADPWLEVSGEGRHLTVRDLDETGPERGRFRLVDLTPGDVLHEGEWEIWRYGAALAQAAVPLFGGVYPPGEPFEPLAVIFGPANSSGEAVND